MDSSGPHCSRHVSPTGILRLLKTDCLPHLPNNAMYSLSSSSGSLFFLGFALLLFFVKNLPSSLQNYVQQTPESLFDITVKDINDADVRLSTYSGKVLLIVNVASKCALTHQNYIEMNILYEKHRDKGFEILAFPCNQFLSQEPGSNEEIQEAACTKFKAEFPIFDKIEVNGRNAAPLYKFLKSKKGGFFGNGIKWNFTKFLVDKQGKVVRRYAPTTSPMKIEVLLFQPVGYENLHVHHLLYED